MKKIKCIKSIIGIGAIGAIGLGVSAGIASCGKATDVVSFDNNYLPSMSNGQEQTFHALSSIDGKISYTAANLPASGVEFNSSIGKLHYTTALPTNQDITITATSDKGGHSSIKITLLADAPVPPTSTPALSASILDNNLQLGTTGTATLSVTEINTTSWTTPIVAVPTGLTASGSWTDTANSLTKTTTISIISDNPPTPGPHTITILADGYDSITQTITILPATTTLVISPTTLANDQTLFAACNLEIDNGILNKKTVWDASKNTTFTNYLIDHHFTTIRFVGITSIASQAFAGCASLSNIYLPTDAAEAIGGECVSEAFYGCVSSGTIWYPTGKESIANDFKSKFTGLANWTPSPIS